MKKQKGVVILFGIFVVVAMLAFGGLAIDIAAVATNRSELHRATDAAALAGAGKLGFDSSVFPTVRDFAVNFGANNATRFGPVALDRNDGNAAGGDVVLGTWDGASFTPSLNGSMVNAVLCRSTQSIPTTFLGILGITALNMSAQSIAVSNPPNSVPGCVFPMAPTVCQYMNAGAFTSQGCGTALTFATSSGKVPGTQAGTNTATWVNLTGTGTPSASNLRAAVAAAADGPCPFKPVSGMPVGTNNGMVQPVIDDLEGYFIPRYNASPMYEITDSSGNTVYTGQGWEVYVPIIEQDQCPPQAINQAHVIWSFSKFVITQIINHGACVVANPADTNSFPLCGTADPSLRAIFGYFECGYIDSTPTSIPAPRAALGTKLRLVQ